jgi:hypothetical protein
MKGFQTTTIAVPTGATGATVPIGGHWVYLIACTSATVGLGFDNLSPQVAYAGHSYAGPADGFKSLRLVDTGSAGATVTLTISDEQLAAPGLNPQVGDTLIPIADKLLAATGNPGTLICAARPNRKRIVIVGDYTMTGVAFIGKDTAVSAVNKAGPVTQYGAWQEQYTGPVYGVGSDALQIVCGYELV